MPCVGFAIQWDKVDIVKAIENIPKGKLKHDTRLWEAEAAESYGIPYSSEWYTLPVIAREHMVASMLGKRWMEALTALEMNK